VEIRRTVPVKLEVPQDREKDLLETIEQFKQAANHVSEAGWNRDGYKETSKTTLHAETYKDVREAMDLQANLVQAARNVAAEAIKSGVEKLKEGEKTSQPRFTADVARYDKRVLNYRDTYCTLATVNGRVEAQYILPEDEDTPHHRYLLNDDYEFRTATLHRRNGDFYLHITLMKTVVGLEKPENGTVLGVDLNVDSHLAATSTGLFVGNADLLNNEREKLERRRRSLQRTGTRSAHLTMKTVGNRFRNWSKNYLHQVSKTIVQEAVNHDIDVIAVENLKNIRNASRTAPSSSNGPSKNYRDKSGTRRRPKASGRKPLTRSTPLSSAATPNVALRTKRTGTETGSSA